MLPLMLIYSDKKCSAYGYWLNRAMDVISVVIVNVVVKVIVVFVVAVVVMVCGGYCGVIGGSGDCCCRRGSSDLVEMLY